MNDFEKLVFEMRKYQKRYFKTRDTAWLTKSKQYEKLVDDHLSNINEPKMF